MITLLPPAKSLDENASFDSGAVTQPWFMDQASEVIKVLKNLSSADIQKLMKVSKGIADINVERFSSFTKKHTTKNAYPALYLYNGDTHKQLERDEYSKKELEYAQNHILFVTGLYGLLRPLDLVQPYRLEFGRKVAVDKAKNLYEYWEDVLANKLNEYVAEKNTKAILNACSKEYAKAINPEKIRVPVVTVEFLEKKSGEYKVVGVLSKKARGSIGNWVIKNKITDIEDVKKFTGDRYIYDASRSTERHFVFKEK